MHLPCRFHTGPFLLVLALLNWAGVARGRPSVFIVNIDGLRCNEGLEAGAANMPFLHDSLRSLGALYTNCYNTGITVTGAGHPTILTGVRQLLVNNDGVWSQIRPREPTIFECFRRETGAPQSEAVYIDGKAQTCRYPVSTWPGYGYQVGPKIVYAVQQSDVEVWDSTRAILARSRPRICYVLLAEVDPAGHSGDTATYLSAIRKADSLTFELWKHLRNDPRYRDSTTLIITSDHGRHDDRHGGWTNHGCACHGCRHVTLLVLGPDTKPDTVVTEPVDQIDIAPTVAHLLGFEMPYAQGRILSEILRPTSEPRPAPSVPARDGRNLSNSTGISRAGDIILAAGLLHGVFADNSSGNWRVLYTRSLDRGTSWSEPRPVLAAPGIEYADPVLAALDDTSLFLSATARRWVPEETTCVWVLRSTRSTDAGASWQDEVELDSLGMVSGRPAVFARQDLVALAYLRENMLATKVSHDRGRTFSAHESVSVATSHYPQYPSLTICDTTVAVAWHAVVPTFAPDSSQYRNVWFSRRPWSVHRTMVTRNGLCGYSREPSLAGGADSVLHLVYADLPDGSVGNDWAIAYRCGPGLGSLWSRAQHLTRNRVGFQPAIRQAEDGRLFCVWTTSWNNQWYISAACSDPSGHAWSYPQSVTEPGVCLSQPRFTVANDTCFVVWESRTAGNWEIYFTACSVAMTGLLSPAPPSRLRLGVYPNPATRNVSLSYELTRPGPVRMVLLDVSGRQVAKLVQGDKPAGAHVLACAVGAVPAGVYYWRLETGAQSACTRLEVLR